MATSQAERTRPVRAPLLLPAVGAALVGWMFPTQMVWMAPAIAGAVLLSNHSQRKVIAALAAIAFLVALFLTVEASLLTAEIAT